VKLDEDLLPVPASNGNAPAPNADRNVSAGPQRTAAGSGAPATIPQGAASDIRQGAPHADVELDADPPAENAATQEAYDPELSIVLRRAAWVGRDGNNSPYVSFSSLFLAVLASKDPLSSWAQEKAGWIGPRLEDIVRRWMVRAPRLAGLNEARVREAGARPERELPRDYAVSPSARDMLHGARALADQLHESGPIGVRHLLAAYAYAVPEEHAHDLETWGLDREAWGTRLLCYATEAYPAQAEAWRAQHEKRFPRPLSASITTALRWATLRSGPEAEVIDSAQLFDGMLLAGLADERHETSASQLVTLLGPGVEGLQLDASASASLPPTPLPVAEEVLPILDRARVLATATRVPRDATGKPMPTLNVRHLIAALLTDRRPLAAFARVRQAGRTEGALLALFRQWLQTIGPGNDDRDRWRALFDELRDHVVAGYDNDEAHGEDRLDISKDVNALAAVLASTKVTPPLSVGLFGDWGSGKSFFMGKLRERIELLASAARAKPEATSWFCGKRGSVLQIDFNAWHYMDADLWSSLAVRVFDALSGELKGEFARACRTQLDSLREREASLQAERATVVSNAEALEGLLQQQRAARAAREVQLAELLKRLAQEQLQKIKEQPDVAKVTAELRLEGSNVKRELQSAQRDLQYVGGRAELWWRTLRSPARLITLALVLGLPAIITVLVASYVHAGGTIVTGLATVTAALVGLFTKVRSFVARVAGPIDAAVSEVARIEQTIRDQKTPDEKELEAERDGNNARIAELEREQLALAKRKAELEAELAALQKGDAKTLREFILERAAAQDYRKNLGVISAIHKDFKQLADFLAPSDSEPNVERIILYVDDLDRCPPKRVVEVLQAIHIILSLPLFVVVVGVDSRWLLDSLSAFYREQFPKDAVPIDVARPQQYLEKIFQVPFTLTPMSESGYGALVGAMLDPTGSRSEAIAAPAAPAAPPETPRHTRGLARATPPTAGAVLARHAPSRAASHQRIDLTPRSLQLEPEELAHLKSLSRLVPTPRAAKRLVNLYRIVRTGLDDDELTELLQGRYKLIQICLGLVIGHPTFGADLFNQVLSGAMKSQKDLAVWQERQRPSAAARDLAALAALEALIAEFSTWPAVIDAVRRVARFSFETGRILALYPAAASAPTS
jgi:KAP family P-loop domain